MAWRPLEDTFHSDRKIRKLARELGIPEPHAAGHVVTLWSWALLHAKDGDLSKFDIDDIEHGAKWDGPYGDFFAGCVEVKLVDVNRDGTVQVHNWLTRGGSFAEAQRKRLKRLKEKKEPLLLPENVRDCPGLSGTIQDCPGKSALEESRIEENTIDHTHTGDVCAQPTPKTSTGQAPQVATGAKAPALALLGGDNGRGEPPTTRDKIAEIWAHYRTYHPKAAKVLKPSGKEYKLTRARLEDFEVDDIKRSIDGYHQSPYHLGQNDQNKKYLGFELMVRDVTHVQQGLEVLDKKKDGQRPRGGQALDPDWLARDMGD